MQYFGFAKCPYCGKRVNVIRGWSLKKEGEYRCPRCSGISNVFHSPLIYVFAVIAFFTSAAIYFFHKFVFDDIELFTFIQVILPFALFFILSIFTVYLKKPVIKKVPKEEYERMTKSERTPLRSDSVNRMRVDGARYQRRPAMGQRENPRSENFSEDTVRTSLNIPTRDELRKERTDVNPAQEQGNINLEKNIKIDNISVRKVSPPSSENASENMAKSESEQMNFFDDE